MMSAEITLTSDSDCGTCEEDSVAYYKGGLYCSEALLKAFDEHYDLGLTPEFRKIATSFGAGLGAAKCACGCLTGGVMVLSLVAGRSTPDVPETAAFESAAALHDAFKQKYRSTCCRVLTKRLEWGSAEHYAQCQRFVGGTAELVETILREQLHVLPKQTASADA
jgi:C_GCAxxG_C_C family probable redox protein